MEPSTVSKEIKIVIIVSKLFAVLGYSNSYYLVLRVYNSSSRKFKEEHSAVI